MNRVKLGVATLAFLALPLAAPAQTDISGPWIVTVDSPQGKMDLDVTFKQAGEKITGEVTSPMGSVDFSGTLVNNALAITYTIPVQGQSLEIKMNGVVEKETISGALDFGGLGQASWTARHKPPASAAASPSAEPASPASAADPSTVNGKWNITVQVGANALPMSGVFKQDGEVVSGSIKTPFGDRPVTGTMVGSHLNLQFTAPSPQGDMAITMTGELGPEGLAGKTALAGLGESDWSAKRVE